MKVEDLLFLIVFFFLGLFTLIGALNEWKWLIDPPLEWSGLYSQAKLKKHFGSQVVKVYTIVFSILFMLFSSYMLFFLIFKSVWISYVYGGVIIAFILSLIVKRIIISIKDKRMIKKYSWGKTEKSSGKITCNKCGYVQRGGNYCENCYSEFSKEME